MKKAGTILIFFSAGLLFALLVWQRHSDRGYFNWRTSLWGDQTGYYVYNPAWFIYGFKADSYPQWAPDSTGYQFLNRENNTLSTKFTCGVALLQAPFFLGVHAINKIKGQPVDGFSGNYNRVPDLAAVFYFLFGLLFLRLFLLRFFKPPVVWLTLAMLVAGSNLLYYATEHTGMSHIYSFFLFSVFLWAFIRQIEFPSRTGIHFITLCISSSMMILVRPTSLMMLAAIPIFSLAFKGSFRPVLNEFMTLRKIILALFIVILVMIPQLIYWKVTTGNFIFYSYKQEGFTNWAHPALLQVWFAPENGLFTNAPISILVIAGLIPLFRQSKWISFLCGGVFLMISYYAGAWHSPAFGCSLGSRNFTEYFALFSLPLGMIAYSILNSGKFMIRFLLTFLTIIFCVVQLRLYTYYNICFPGGTWNWKTWGKILLTTDYTARMDFEGKWEKGVETEGAPSGKKVFRMDEKTIYSPEIKFKQENRSLFGFRRCFVSIQVKSEMEIKKAEVILGINDSSGKEKYRGTFPISISPDESGKWKLLTNDFWMNLDINPDDDIKIFVWNKGAENLEVDNIIAKFW